MNLILRHCLATLRYRTRNALIDAPADFGAFSAGAGVRTPIELLRHMTQLAAYSYSQLGSQPRATLDGLHSLEAELVRFERALSTLSLDLASRELSEDLASRLLQGPLADAMTHAGQLALLRRLAGSSAPAHNFFMARIDCSDLES